MGIIKQDVQDIYFSQHPTYRDFLQPFLFCFNINYASEKQLANTTVHAFILEPEAFMKESFGLSKEIILIYTSFSKMEARTMQALHMLFSEFPFSGRIDDLVCFLVSKDDDVVEWLKDASLVGDSTQIIIPFSKKQLVDNRNDTWYIRNQFRERFFGVDLFDYSLPLNDDTYFFGRQQVLARLVDSIKRCENRGVFGLRKTGKTSLMFKLDRTIREQRIGFVFFYDCKSPSYRKMHWNQLLGEICSNIAKRLGIWIKTDYSEDEIIRSFRYVAKEASMKGKRIILLFDEIEYISFKAPLDDHWRTEFIDFWQTIWSVQSRHRNLVFILSGVNPSAIEIDLIGTTQNPLFGIVHSEYLKGLSKDETRTMVRTLGRRMGLKFSYDAIDELFNQYGGHPMLTRLACSKINQHFDTASRPIDITLAKVASLMDQINSELTYYFAHVVSEIKQFYGDEYELFELLASGQTNDFLALAQISDYSKHLYDYGLVANDPCGIPIINMPVAGRYAAMQLAKKEKRETLYRLVEKNNRSAWIKNKSKEIIRYIRQLEKVISLKNNVQLFGVNSFPEADSFYGISEVTRKSDFTDFINICNRCFVESIENYGKSLGKQHYFWQDVKTAYPNLFKVLERIKTYRHSQDHIKLNNPEAIKYQQFWSEDTYGLHDESEQYFCIQQKILDMLVTCIQIEINQLT